LFTIQLGGVPWEKRKLAAVVVACIGVVAIVYGGVAKTVPDIVERRSQTARANQNTLFGNILAFAASIWYALFQVVYKIHVALPNDPDADGDRMSFSPLSVSSADEHESDQGVDAPLKSLEYPPFGLHPNFLLSSAGTITMFCFAVPFPILDYYEVEKFRIPDASTALSIFAIAMTGLIFNSGFMVLLGLWGPVITSVGGLLTIILVLVSDVLFVEGFGILTLWNSLGSCAIIGGFAILASEFRRRG